MIVTNDFHMFRAKNSSKTRFAIRRASCQNTEANYHPIECPRIFSHYAILVYESNIVKVIPPEIRGGIYFEENLTKLSS